VRDESQFARWRKAADSSLQEGRLLIDAGEHRHACQHAEQAAELAVKGLLHAVGRGGQARGHCLTTLGKAVQSATGTGPSDEVHAALAALSQHYLPFDHPHALAGGAPDDDYRASDAVQACTEAEAVLSFVDDAWCRLIDAAPQQPAGTE